MFIHNFCNFKQILPLKIMYFFICGLTRLFILWQETNCLKRGKGFLWRAYARKLSQCSEGFLFKKQQSSEGALPLRPFCFGIKFGCKPHHLFLLKEKGGKKFKSAHTPSMHEAVKCLKSWNTFYRPLSISSDSCADGGSNNFSSPISLLLFLKLKESSPMGAFV